MLGSGCWGMLLAALWDGWTGKQAQRWLDALQPSLALTASRAGRDPFRKGYCWVWFKPSLVPHYWSLKGMWKECGFSAFRCPSVVDHSRVHRAWDACFQKRGLLCTLRWCYTLSPQFKGYSLRRLDSFQIRTNPPPPPRWVRKQFYLGRIVEESGWKGRWGLDAPVCLHRHTAALFLLCCGLLGTGEGLVKLLTLQNWDMVVSVKFPCLSDPWFFHIFSFSQPTHIWSNLWFSS